MSRERKAVPPRLSPQWVGLSLAFSALMALGFAFNFGWRIALLIFAAVVLLTTLPTLWMLHHSVRPRSSVSPEPVDPVIAVADDGPAEVHLRLRAALSDMEAVDVSHDVYRVYLPDGEILQLWIAARDQVMATPTGRFDRPAAVAAMRAAGFLASSDEDLEGAVWRAAKDGPG